MAQYSRPYILTLIYIMRRNNTRSVYEKSRIKYNENKSYVKTFWNLYKYK